MRRYVTNSKRVIVVAAATHRVFRGAWEADDPAVVAIVDSLIEAEGF